MLRFVLLSPRLLGRLVLEDVVDGYNVRATT